MTKTDNINSDGNNNSHGNNRSDGNNYSHGNNYSYGNNHSDGNNWSYGNNHSNGNNWSYGNNWSDGNNHSNGNSYSHGNNHSDGNNNSYGNDCSMFLFNCRGSYKSVLCKDQRGIAYMVLNQQLSEEDSEDFQKKLTEIIDHWLPYTTNYTELKEKGWHTEYNEDNEYVSDEISGEVYEDAPPYTKQYHYAWSKCPKKQEIIDLIKFCKYLDTEPALKVFTKITGIDTKTITKTKKKGEQDEEF